MTQEEPNKAIARLLRSTRRRNRIFSLVDVANDIRLLLTSLGSLGEVSKVIGISTGMLNQFLSVFKLPESAMSLVQKREIDSVSVVHYLSKFNEDDITQLSGLLKSDKLNSQDLRALLTFRKQFPNSNILDLVEKIHSSKNIKVSVVRIYAKDTKKSIEELNTLFSDIIGARNMISVLRMENYIDIKITKEGEKTLRSSARESGKSLQEFVSILIS